MPKEVVIGRGELRSIEQYKADSLKALFDVEVATRHFVRDGCVINIGIEGTEMRKQIVDIRLKQMLLLMAEGLADMQKLLLATPIGE
jgi:hypothetical protein